VELLPHGYTNHVTREGSVVTKSYQGPDASHRCAREAAALSALAGRLPVPPVIDRSDTILRLGLMRGVPGQDLIDDGLAGQVLRACGQLLRRIHAIDPAELDLLSRHEDSAVLVHGDYGPQNILLDAAAAEVIAVVDWEWVHGADPVEDVAWCEWIVRMHHPESTAALSSFFDGYGRRPPWPARQQAMVEQCRALLALSERWEPRGEAARLWQQRIQATESWTE
jgi:Ser/Thr protein kinase RdoA (MazF antagonist)